MLCALKLPNLYFTSSQRLTILFKLNLSFFLRFTFASLTLISIREVETLPFLIWNIFSYVCIVFGVQDLG